MCPRSQSRRAEKCGEVYSPVNIHLGLVFQVLVKPHSTEGAVSLYEFPVDFLALNEIVQPR